MYFASQVRVTVLYVYVCHVYVLPVIHLYRLAIIRYSPLGATKTNSPFIGSQCFRRANEALEKMGLQEINWNVDECENQTEATDITV